MLEGLDPLSPPPLPPAPDAKKGPELDDMVDDDAPEEKAKEETTLIEETETVKGAAESFGFQTETAQILDIVARSLYTEKEVCAARHPSTGGGKAQQQAGTPEWLAPFRVYLRHVVGHRAILIGSRNGFGNTLHPRGRFWEQGWGCLFLFCTHGGGFWGRRD